MNQNIQNPFTQKEKSPQFPQFSKIQKNSETNQNPHLSPINRVSILKTEEQKEIVRTNVYDPNDSSGNKKEFCVVTEIIRRKSNIPLPSKSNSVFNLNPMRFSFNQQITEPPFSTNLNIDINNSKLKNSKKSEKYENYKIIVKRIASQLNAQIRPPAQGFFYFAMLKGDYPLMIIKKIEKDIINHKIDLDNDIFRIYSEKYMRYIELVKKIAHLLKVNLKNKMFWENEKYNKINTKKNEITAQNVQEKTSNDNIIPINFIPDNKNVNSNNLPKQCNIIFSNSNNQYNINKNNLQNKTAQNVTTTLTFNNKINNNTNNQTLNITFTQKNMNKNNFVFQPKRVFNNSKSNNVYGNNTNIIQNNIGVQNSYPVINPFNINQKKNNFIQNNEILINQFIKPTSIKNMNNNYDNKEEKTQVINLEKRNINNEIKNNNSLNLFIYQILE